MVQQLPIVAHMPTLIAAGQTLQQPEPMPAMELASTPHEDGCSDSCAAGQRRVDGDNQPTAREDHLEEDQGSSEDRRCATLTLRALASAWALIREQWFILGMGFAIGAERLGPFACVPVNPTACGFLGHAWRVHGVITHAGYWVTSS